MEFIDISTLATFRFIYSNSQAVAFCNYWLAVMINAQTSLWFMEIFFGSSCSVNT